MKYKGIPYDFVDCNNQECPGFVESYPTISMNGQVYKGFTELQSEQGDSKSQEECLGQRLDWLQDGDVLGKRSVPQETHEQSQKDDPNEKHNQVVQKLLCVA